VGILRNAQRSVAGTHFVDAWLRLVWIRGNSGCGFPFRPSVLAMVCTRICRFCAVCNSRFLRAAPQARLKPPTSLLPRRPALCTAFAIARPFCIARLVRIAGASASQRVTDHIETSKAWIPLSLDARWLEGAVALRPPTSVP
jgi:hypothetical protein